MAPYHITTVVLHLLRVQATISSEVSTPPAGFNNKPETTSFLIAPRHEIFVSLGFQLDFRSVNLSNMGSASILGLKCFGLLTVGEGARIGVLSMHMAHVQFEKSGFPERPLLQASFAVRSDLRLITMLPATLVRAYP